MKQKTKERLKGIEEIYVSAGIERESRDQNEQKVQKKQNRRNKKNKSVKEKMMGGSTECGPRGILNITLETS